MDNRGGKITWYLDADDTGFDKVNRRVREESKRTGKDVDRNFKKGTNGAKDSLRDFRVELSQTASVVRNFDVAMRGFNMSTLILGAVAATGAVLELGSALVASTGSLVAVPGILAPFAGAVATVKTAIIGLGDAFDAVLDGDAEDLAEAMKKLSPAAREVVTAFSDIKDAFAPVQQAVQEAFFVGLGKQMREVTTAVLPALEAGLTGVATSMNKLLIEAANVAKEPFFRQALSDSLATTSQATDTLTEAVRPLAQAVAGLVEIGLPYTNMLAEWVVSLSQSAAQYTNSVEGQKALTDAINLGIDALQSIGTLTLSVGKFFFELFKVSNESGVSFIDTLTQIIDKMTGWLQSADGQRQMQALLEVTNEVFLQTLDVVGKVALVILDIIEAFNNAPEPIKNTVIQFLAWTAVLTPITRYVTALGVSLNTTYEIIKLGGVSLLKGATALSTFAKGWQLAAQGIGMAGTQGSLIARLGVVAQKAASAIGGAFVKSVKLAGSALLFLGKAMLTNPIGIIITSIVALVAAFIYLWNNVEGFRNFWIGIWDGIKGAAEAVSDWFTGTFIPIMSGLWKGIIKATKAFANFWVNVWKGIVDIAKDVATVFMVIMKPFIAVFNGIMFVLKALYTIWATIWLGVLQVIITIVSTIVQIIMVVLYGVFLWMWNNILTPTYNFFVTVFTAIVTFVSAMFVKLIGIIVDVMKAVYNFISGILTAIFNFFVTIFTAVYSFVAGIVTGIFNVIVSVFNGIKNFVVGVFSAVRDYVVGVWSGIRDTLAGIVGGIASTIKNRFNDVKDAVFGVVKAALDRIKGFVGDFINAGKDLIAGLVKGIGSAKDAVVNKVKDIAKGALDSVKSFFGIKSPSKVMAQIGVFMMQGLENGIVSAGQSVADSSVGVASQISDSFGGLGEQDFTSNVMFNAASADLGSVDLNSNGASGREVTINQYNTVNSEVDMDVVNRRLTWEVNRA